MTRLLALLMLLLSGPLTAQAMSPQDLVDRGELTLTTSLSPDTGIVPRQRVQLIVEVATTSWFTGGTRITIPEVPGLVILQTEQFASNASEQRNGQTWVIQRWSLELYPQREGGFTVPPLMLAVSVSAGGTVSATGPVAAPGLRFSATLPPALATIEDWVAAPEFSVSQTLDRDLDALTVGDAIERRVQFEARDVMSMMLPELPGQPVAGIAAYPLPPTLENRNNRGVATALRLETVSYVLQQPGNYQLPPLEFAWWDTSNQELQLVTLPAIAFSVMAAASTKKRPDRADLARLALGAGVVAIVLAVVAWLSRRVKNLPWHRAVKLWRATTARLRQLREPVLPNQLNPGGNAGD